VDGIVIKGCEVFRQGVFVSADVEILDGVVTRVEPGIVPGEGVSVCNFDNCLVVPGLVDVHVHLREPGFSYKETIKSGTEAAARSGYAAVCAMPNLSPVPEDAATLAQELDLIARDAAIDVLPYGAITRGQKGAKLADMAAMAPYVCGFSDDGHGVQSAELMREAMLEAGRLGRPIAAHCEDNSLLRGGYIHDGEYAAAHGHRGICSESEWGPIERDIGLLRGTGCAYHVCHISTAESAELIRRAKAEGLNISCETAPHYLLLSDAELQEDGRFKMNPPLRGEADRLALIEALRDGTIDMIATDHAPHSAEEKSRGLEKSAFGITGLETAFPVLWTGLVEPGIIGRERLAELMSTAPARRFGIESGIELGKPASLAVFDVSTTYTIDPAAFASKGRATPFGGRQVRGRCVLNICRGREVWRA
jgi:dihydroorotase